MQLRISILVTLAVITTCLIIVPKTTLSQSVVAEKSILDYKIDTGIRLHPGLVRKLTHGQIEKDIVQWVMDNFDTVGGANVNIANHSLVANGDYTQTWAKHQLLFNNVSKFGIIDTFGNTIISNDPALIAQSSFFTSQNNITGNYNLRVNNGASNRALIDIISTTSANNMILRVDNRNGLLIDSNADRTRLGQFNSGKYGVSVNRTTGEVMIDSEYYLPTAAGAGLGYVLTTTSTYGTAWQPITSLSLITNYNGSSTAGNGLWVIRAHGSFKNRTSNTTILTYSVPVDGEYFISGYFSANSITGSTYYLLDFTDQNGVAHTGVKIGDLSTPNILVEMSGFEIQAKSGTTITLYMQIQSGTIDADISGTVTQIDN